MYARCLFSRQCFLFRFNSKSRHQHLLFTAALTIVVSLPIGDQSLRRPSPDSQTDARSLSTTHSRWPRGRRRYRDAVGRGHADQPRRWTRYNARVPDIGHWTQACLYRHSISVRQELSGSHGQWQCRTFYLLSVPVLAVAYLFCWTLK